MTEENGLTEHGQRFFRAKEFGEEQLKLKMAELLEVAKASQDPDVHQKACEVIYLERFITEIFTEATRKFDDFKPEHPQDYGGETI